MSHRYDAKVFGPKDKGEFHVVHDQGKVAVASFNAEADAKASAEDRTARAKSFGIKATYGVQLKSDGEAVT